MDEPPPEPTDAELADMDRAMRIMQLQAAVLRYLTWCVGGWAALTGVLVIVLGPDSFDWWLFLLAGVAFTMLVGLPFYTDLFFPVIKRGRRAMNKSAEWIAWKAQENVRGNGEHDDD